MKMLDKRLGEILLLGQTETPLKISVSGSSRL